MSTPELADQNPGSLGAESQAKERSWRTWVRRIGLVLAILGLLAIGWGLTTVFWQEPFTGAYTAWKQRQLEGEYERNVASYEEQAVGVTTVLPQETVEDIPLGDGVSPSLSDQRAESHALTEAGLNAERQRLARLAADYRETLPIGEPMGRITIPRLDVDSIVVNGAGGAELRSGPGRDVRTFMPGEGELVYIAGHRTTYGAIFRHIDDLEPGDPIIVEVPYGRFEYRVTGQEAVYPYQVEKLESNGREELAIQASHPPYSASQRLIVHARFIQVGPLRPN